MFLELLLYWWELHLIPIVSIVDSVGPSNVDSQPFLPLGFADIPTGKASPYVLRRTTMPTRTSPRLAAQKLAPSPLSLNKENHAETSQPTAGGSRSQKVTPRNVYLPSQIREITVLSGKGLTLTQGLFKVWPSSPISVSKPVLRTVVSRPGDKHYIILHLQSPPWSNRPLRVGWKMLNEEKS